MQKTVFILVGWAVFYYLKNKSENLVENYA